MEIIVALKDEIWEIYFLSSSFHVSIWHKDRIRVVNMASQTKNG